MFDPPINLSRKIKDKFTLTSSVYFRLLCLYFSIEYEDVEACHSFIDSHKSICDTKVKKNPPRTVRYTYILSEPNLSLRRIFRYSTFFSHALVSNARFSRFKVRMTTHEFLSPCRTWLFHIFFVCKHFRAAVFITL